MFLVIIEVVISDDSRVFSDEIIVVDKGVVTETCFVIVAELGNIVDVVILFIVLFVFINVVVTL